MKVNFKSIFMLIFLVVAIIVGVTLISNNFDDDNAPVYSDILELFDEDRVESFVIDGNLNIRLQVLRPKLDENKAPIPGQFEVDPKTGKYITDSIEYALSDSSQRDEIYEIAREKTTSGEFTNLKHYDATRPEGTPWYLAYLPYRRISF